MQRVPTRRALLAPDIARGALADLCSHYAAEALQPLSIRPSYLDTILPVLVPESRGWSTATVQRLAREVANGEVELLLYGFEGFHGVVRRIETVTLRIMRDFRPTPSHPSFVREYLIERRWDGSRWAARRHANSMSEKLTADERVSRNHVAAVARAFEEELGIVAEERDLAPERLFPVPVNRREDRLRRSLAVHDLPPVPPGQSLHWSERYPGLVTWNTLHHFYWLMPEHHWRDQYTDNQTGHRFEWSDDYRPITTSGVD